MLILPILIISLASFRLRVANAAATRIYIKSDGSIEPSTDSVATNDNITYHMTTDLFGHIIIERSNITLDGNNSLIQGAGIAGWIGIFVQNCTSVTLTNIRVNAFDVGIWFGNTTHSKAVNTTLTSIEYAFQLGNSNGNIIIGNHFISNDFGIRLSNSSNNAIIKNEFRNGYDAIWLVNDCTGNQIIGNDINTNIGIAIGTDKSSNNRFYHNNIENNTSQIYSAESMNIWDDGYPSGGNYWSIHNNTDDFQSIQQNVTGGDAISDNPYIIDANNTDRFPLAGRFHDFIVYTKKETEHIHVVSNSSISSFRLLRWNETNTDLLQPNQTYIDILLTEAPSNTKFCRLTLSKRLLNDSYMVFIDSELTASTEINSLNDSTTFLYFSYEGSSHEIIVISEATTLSTIALLVICGSTLTINRYYTKRVKQDLRRVYLD